MAKNYKRLRPKKTKRVCLRCDSEFPSDGIYNRICPNCRESNANVSEMSAESYSSGGLQSKRRYE